MNDTIPATAANLGLEPHPEGGWFKRTWTSPIPLNTPAGVRPTATGIHYLLTPGERSAWHVVTSDELWLWHGPGILLLHLGGTGASPCQPSEVTTLTLGPDAGGAHVAQGIVPAGTWQAAELGGDEQCLVTCIVSPGFEFTDWKLAED